MGSTGDHSLGSDASSGSEYLHDYRLLRRVGAGSYGDVWLAEDAVGKHVAVKVIDRERLALISRTNREERGLSLIRTQLPEHEHLIRVHHVGNDDARLYYVMDLADPRDSSQSPSLDVQAYRPRSLDDEITIGNPMPIPQAIGIVRQLLSAVTCLHENGIVHRDIKPSNILCVGGVWKLADIGLLSEERPEMTVVGTPDFMPPDSTMDRSADLYALGKLLYCLVTGDPASSFPALPPHLLSSEQRCAVSEVNEIITRACHPKRDARFKSAEEFDEALSVCLRRIEKGPPRFNQLVRFGIPAILILGLCGYALMSGLFGSRAEIEDGEWVELFNGRDLSGWFTEHPNHGEWFVQEGTIRCKQDETYKTLLSEDQFGPGVFRATIIPDHDGARLGIGYLGPRGPLFMFMGDKYTWIRGYRETSPPDEAGNWLSFPGPILQAGEAAELEVRYGPDGVVLSVNGEVLQQLDGVDGTGRLLLHVWQDDAGGFQGVRFRETEK